MSLFHLAYVIARRRIVSGWQLELVVFLGIVLSVALLSSSLVFSDLLAESALQRALQEATAEETSFWVRAFSSLDDPAVTGRLSSYETSVNVVRARVLPRLREFSREGNQVLETATFFFTGHPQLDLPNEERPRGRVQYMAAVGDTPYTRLVDGRWPQPGGPGRPPLEVTLDETGARLLQLGVGDTFRAFPASAARTYDPVDVSIVGIFQREEPDSPFWQGQERSFSYQDNRWTIVPLFTTEENILTQVGAAYPGLYYNVSWVFNLDRQGIRVRDVGDLQQAIRQVRAEVVANLTNGSAAIRLDRLLDRYSQQLLLARIPLFLMVFLVIGILAYYLALVAGLTVRSRSAEIAMLKSRGATTLQIGLLMLVEGLLLAVPAVIIGTSLSPLVAGALGGLFFPVAAGLVPGISLGAFLLGIGGALLAVGVLSVSTLAAARRGIVEFRQAGARPATTPFFHRYYLDILLLAVIGLIWWQMQSRGSFLVQSFRSNQLEIDFALLLAPVLGLLALGLLILRFFPLALALLARATGPVGPVWLAQGLRRVSRDPLVPGSLVVLLMLATSLGVIGSAFSSTLDRSQRDRAMYQSGADLKLVHGAGSSGTASLGLGELLSGVGPVEGAAEAHRLSAHLLTRGFGITRVSTLGVDTRHFGEVAWYREDFSPGRSLPDLSAALSPPPGFQEDGVSLSPDATSLALWVHPDRPDPRVNLQARLLDSRGQYFDVPLGDLGVRGWQKLEAGLDPPEVLGRRPADQEHPVPPFSLLALHLSSRVTVSFPGAVFLDSLSVETPGGERVLSELGSLDGWHVIEDHARPGLYALEASESVVRAEGRPSAVFSWAPGGLGLRGLRHGAPEEPIPALVSPGLLAAAQAREGDALALGMSTFALPIRPVAVADYFPTLDPRQEPFVVVDLRNLLHYSNRHNQRIVGGPTEVWVKLNGGPEGAPAVIQALRDGGMPVRESLLAADLVEQRLDQPLTNASWGGLLVLMFLALTLAGASGVVLFSYTDTRERQTEFALLRTLGSSPGQINAVVWFSLFLVVACGIALGSWAGQQIGASILPILEIAEGGTRVTPPMVLQTNWAVLAASYLVLAGVTAATVAWLAWFTARLEVQQVLRAGEAGK